MGRRPKLAPLHVDAPAPAVAESANRGNCVADELCVDPDQARHDDDVEEPALDSTVTNSEPEH